MFRNLINYYLPPKLSENDNLKTERIFVIVLIISAISNLLGIPLSFHIEIPLVAYLLLANTTINIVLLFLYKKGVSRPIVGHVYLTQHAVSFAVQAYAQGGLMTPATFAFFLLPALAMLILGKKASIWWLSISVLMTVGFFIYETFIGSIPISYNLEKQSMFFLNSLIGINVTIFFILLVYEKSKNKAFQEVQKKHNDLIATQAQLFQSEKMASLGELTAGIAHEIQNPLNFVNNFSEVNRELVDELKEELATGNKQLANEIADDIKENEEKINLHGKRAEAIVKGMLQHSRTNSGEKELTDINALADEYLRLSYHGLRAKDKTFNADFKTEFDETLPKINVVPQDIGRVLLNLINNAFYAVDKKAKENDPLAPKGETEEKQVKYKPEVVVSTSFKPPFGGLGGQVEISVSDNGPGIPPEIKDKIFQPFFTTKPTGSGTGLGLSLSYDIIKAHDGTISIDSEENLGTEFLIIIPVKQ